MLLTEWKFEDALRVREQEGIEIGEEKTLKQIEELIKQGVTDANEILKTIKNKHQVKQN